jgi:hypothetical protein
MRVSFLCSGLLFTCGGCVLWSQPAGTDGFSQYVWAIIQPLSPLPDLPVDSTNKYRDSPAAAS